MNHEITEMTLTFLCSLALKRKYFQKVIVHVRTFRTLRENNFRVKFPLFIALIKFIAQENQIIMMIR